MTDNQRFFSKGARVALAVLWFAPVAATRRRLRNPSL